MTKNVTLRVDEAILKKARHQAVEADKSLSQWVIDLIAREVARDEAYEAAKRRALRRMERGLNLGGKPIPREELHERP
ncbi:MAG TPA: YlcI/YnfO family protein [Phycisphaerae bacterium]|nr:YlcI/YnfO family protein [Phycisphaerae bacterium]